MGAPSGTRCGWRYKSKLSLTSESLGEVADVNLKWSKSNCE